MLISTRKQGMMLSEIYVNTEGDALWRPSLPLTDPPRDFYIELEGNPDLENQM